MPSCDKTDGPTSSPNWKTSESTPSDLKNERFVWSNATLHAAGITVFIKRIYPRRKKGASVHSTKRALVVPFALARTLYLLTTTEAILQLIWELPIFSVMEAMADN